MVKETFQKSVESAKYDFIRDKAQKETIELLAKTLIEVKGYMNAYIPEKVFDMVDEAISKSGYNIDNKIAKKVKSEKLIDKIKWSYDKKNEEWYVCESFPYANDGLSISKDGERYKLCKAYLVVGRFNKLSSAKTVANLLRNG